MPWWTTALQALWLFLPAYVANMSPVFSAKLAPRWTAPIDGGRLGRDGHPVLGPGKTWRGLAGGALGGGLTALAMAFAAGGIFEDHDFGLGGYDGGPLDDGRERAAAAHASAASPAWAVFLFGAAVGLLALVGDAVKSYFKRRRGVARGRPWVPFDQLDFVVFGLLGALLASPLLTRGWALEAYFGHWLTVVTLLVLTPGLHLLVNIIGHRLRLKDVPW